MMLRVVLVGVVAALGVTLPSQAHCDKWFDLAQDWASSVLADWDTWKPRDSDGNACRLDAGGAAECPECRLARARLVSNQRKPTTSNDFKTPAVETRALALGPQPAGGEPHVIAPGPAKQEPISFEPIVVAENLDLGVAYELNRLSEGVAVAPVPAVRCDEPLSPGDPIPCSEHLELSLLSQLWRFAGERWIHADSGRPGEAAVGELDQTVDEFWLCGENDDVVAPTEPAVASQPKNGAATIKDAAAAATSPEACTDFDLEMAFEIAQSLGKLPTPRPVPVVPDLPRDVFAPAQSTAVVTLPRAVRAPARETVLADLPVNVFAPPAVNAEPQSHVANESEPGLTLGVIVEAEAEILSASQRQIASVDESAQASAAIGSRSQTPIDPRAACPEKTSAAPGATASGSFPQPEFGDAVELTREALFAWMKVLAGPAVVDVTTR
jgi:hypothetical protein